MYSEVFVHRRAQVTRDSHKTRTDSYSCWPMAQTPETLQLAACISKCTHLPLQYLRSELTLRSEVARQ